MIRGCTKSTPCIDQQSALEPEQQAVHNVSLLQQGKAVNRSGQHNSVEKRESAKADENSGAIAEIDALEDW